jgi:hypothetical protein
MFKKVFVSTVMIVLCLVFLMFESQANQPDLTAKLEFSTYISHMDKYFANFDIHVDEKGFLYASGNTRDKNFPVTSGAYQTELKGEADAFVVKFSPEGDLIFATFVGGTKREHHTGFTVDADGFIYMVGGTHSSDFPVTPGAYDTTFNGEKDWGGDVYLVKLNPSGSDIVFSSFIGGSEQETAANVVIDVKGNIIVGGIVLSPDFPITSGAIDKIIKKEEVFVAKFSPEGDKLLFSTFFGGDQRDGLAGLAVDENCNIYISGTTRSENLPVTSNAFRNNLEEASEQPTFTQGLDHYIAKLNEDATEILFCSYFAGNSHVESSLQWASPNRLIMTGSVNKENFPISENAVMEERKGNKDGYVAIFNSDDMTLKYTTLLGGSEYDHIGSAFFLDDNKIVVGGITNSADFPLSENALDSDYPESDKLFNSGFLGKRKAFVSVIDIKKGELLYSSYLGACLRFKIFPNQDGKVGFASETGFHGFPGTTDFPLSREPFQFSPSFFTLGKLALDEQVLGQ